MTYVISPLTPALSPLRGEGAVVDSRSYSCVVQHGYDGVQRTARPANSGSWAVSKSEGNTELSLDGRANAKGTGYFDARSFRRAGCLPLRREFCADDYLTARNPENAETVRRKKMYGRQIKPRGKKILAHYLWADGVASNPGDMYSNWSIRSFRHCNQ